MQPWRPAKHKVRKDHSAAEMACSPGSPVPFPAPGSTLTGFTTLKGEAVPWQTVGIGIASLGTPSVSWMLCPILGVVIAVIEVAAMLTIIGTALFGSPALSERAFRLLRWLFNRPEPPAPEAPVSKIR
jgi:hypothetical protein